ncbi:HD domain-containing phosphohydrolase [Petrotoga olearia]|uniref:Phosphohydrolase n=2 Tax=Petrotoga olearia TaxID=156203 RepID=A0A2K1P4G6_9BACT|nr:HD domain-containing phosphohydrolase [Petrotoga olearia]PNR97683.1 phosphohydrolase [Petrotoga olearia DSM 13574]RMA76759.1 HD domain-containing protein [Petrotoga olearia]
MKKNTKARLLLLLLILSGIYSLATTNILILNSYNPGLSWSDRELEGIYSVLKDEESINIYVEYLDSKRFGDDKSLNIFKEYFERKFSNFRFDVVIALDNNAFDFVLSNYESLFLGTPIVYAGINYYQEYDLSSLDFVSGIVEIHDIKETLELALNLHPNTENVYVIVDNQTKTGKLFKQEVENDVIPEFEDINFIFLSDSLDQIKQELDTPLQNSIVLLLAFSKDIYGNFYDYTEIEVYMGQFENLPIYVTSRAYMANNVVGGKITSAYDQGLKAGEIAKGLLSGVNIKELPRIYFPDNKYVFNFPQLERFGISTKSLPADSTIENKPPSFYENYPVIFWLIMILVPFSIIFIYVLREENLKLHSLLKELNQVKEEAQSYNEELTAANEQLTSYNEELISQNEEIQSNYQEIEQLNNKMINLLEIISELGNEELKEEDFFQKFLNTLIIEIPEADYGSVSIIEEDSWRFLAALGHDINGLNSLNLKKSYALRVENATVFDNINSVNEETMPQDVVILISKFTKPIKSTLLKAIKIDENRYLDVSLDIKEGSDEKFSEQSVRFFDSILNLAKMFFVNRIRTQEVKNAYATFSSKLSILAESHDENSKKHIYRVSELSAFFAEKLGLPKEQVERIRDFSPLHDVGKLFIPAEILNKPGKLNEKEWEEIKKHPLYADNLLEGSYFETAKKIALYHHERYDGNGYPFRLRGKQIPIEAQIVGLVDVYDALRSKRSYKEAFSHREAVDILLHGDNRTKPEHFNPKLLEILKRYEREIEELYKKYEE